MSQKKSDGKSQHGSFERSLRRLEEIIEALEGGSISLDDVMKMYEEGVGLSKQCLDELAKAELKLKVLSKDVNGKFELLDRSDEK